MAFGDEVRQALGGLPIEGLASASQVQLKGYSEDCNVYSMRATAVTQLISVIEAAPPSTGSEAGALPIPSEHT